MPDAATTRSDDQLRILRGIRGALVFLCVIAAGALMLWFRALVTPLVLAGFLLLLIDALSRRAGRAFPRSPQWLRLLIVALVIAGAFLAVVAVCVARAPVLAAHLLEVTPRLDAVIASAAARVGAEAPSLNDLLGRVNAAQVAGPVLSAAGHFGESALLTVILLAFMTASRAAFARKVPRLVTTREGRQNLGEVFSHVRDVSESYVLLQTVKALLISVPVGLVMVLFGVRDALFIAFLIFLLSYVPLVGAVVSVLLPAIFAFAQFPEFGRPLLVTVIIGVLVFSIDHFVMPKLQSDRLNLDPVVVILSLGFWGLLLGAPGALLSTPLTVVVMTVAAEFDTTRWFAVLLSKTGEPGAPGHALPATAEPAS